MSDTNEDRLDARLRELFEAADPPADDAAFVAQVMRRIEHRMIVRRAVLGAAFLVGVAVAGAPLAELATSFSAWLVGRAAVWFQPDADLSLTASAAIALMGLCFGAYRWLTR